MAGFDQELSRRGVKSTKDSFELQSARTLKMRGETVINVRAGTSPLIHLPENASKEQIIQANNAMVSYLHSRFLAELITVEADPAGSTTLDPSETTSTPEGDTGVGQEENSSDEGNTNPPTSDTEQGSNAEEEGEGQPKDETRSRRKGRA